MVFLPILSRGGGLTARRLYATCVGVIFPVCLVSAGVYLFPGEAFAGRSAALPPGRAHRRLPGGKLYGKVSTRWLKWLFARLSLLCGGEISAVMNWLLPFLCGLGAGMISAWGVGGGTLLLLVMTLFLGVDQRSAQGINLLFFLPTAASAWCVTGKTAFWISPP